MARNQLRADPQLHHGEVWVHSVRREAVCALVKCVHVCATLPRPFKSCLPLFSSFGSATLPRPLSSFAKPSFPCLVRLSGAARLDRSLIWRSPAFLVPSGPCESIRGDSRSLSLRDNYTHVRTRTFQYATEA